VLLIGENWKQPDVVDVVDGRSQAGEADGILILVFGNVRMMAHYCFNLECWINVCH
jgi:hypothetical protein